MFHFTINFLVIIFILIFMCRINSATSPSGLWNMSDFDCPNGWFIESLCLLLLRKIGNGLFQKHEQQFIRSQLATFTNQISKVLYYYDWKCSKTTLLSWFWCCCLEFGNLLQGKKMIFFFSIHESIGAKIRL